VSDAEAVFVAVPVGALPDVARAVLAAAPADCVVSDVGSTKRAIVAALGDTRFVGGHPLAGAETSGVEHARADLFDGATWYLTPTSRTSGILYERLHRLLHGIGARPVAIEPDVHDTVLATVSHLPHVLANVLVSQAARTLELDSHPPSHPPQRLPATGPSFRDATRVAGAPSAIWTDIYVSNRDAIGARIDDTIARLTYVREALASGDAGRLTEWNDGAAEDRRRLLEAQLAGGPLFELRASVPNRPGVVAELALELGRAGVNITDMALYPAPDMSEGVVAMWIAGESEARRAEELVGRLGFPVARA
jgi:prephenate dehydrogenase